MKFVKHRKINIFSFICRNKETNKIKDPKIENGLLRREKRIGEVEEGWGEGGQEKGVRRVDIVTHEAN